MADNGHGTPVIDPIGAGVEIEPGLAPIDVVPVAAEPDNKPKEKTIFAEIYDAKNVRDIIPRVKRDIERLIASSTIANKYSFFFLYDDGSDITRGTSNRLYSAISACKEGKPLYLLIHSGGGKVEPAYLISKCCKNSSRGQGFVVSVPRFAKSAATLIALGADEVHMGVISELGPIDPQVGSYPALGLGSAINYIAGLCKQYPDAKEMLAQYLSTSLNLHDLGYLERVSESAAQYAERLLSGKEFPDGQTAARIAKRFVYGYKDHGFVIDRDEARTILGEAVVKFDTPEYQLASQIHEYLDEVNVGCRIWKSHFCKVVGTLSDGLMIWELPKE